MTSAGGVGGQAFGGGMLAGAKKFVAPLAGLFAAGAIVDFFKDAAAAAIDDEKSVVALSTAMDNLGMSSANAVAEEFVSGLQKATGSADDELRPALQKLLTATGDLTQSQELLALAQDISAGTGRDLASVTQGLARASMGQFSALTRMGIPLDANIIKTKDFGAAVGVLTDKFGGQAAAAAATYGGQLKILATAADEAKETIGYALLDAINSASDAFGGTGGMVEGITAAGETLADFVAGLGQAMTTLAEFLSMAGQVSIGVGDADISLGDLAMTVAESLPIIGLQIQGYQKLTESGGKLRASQDRIKESLAGSEALYAGYTASLDGAAAETRSLEMDTEAAKEATEALKDAQSALNDMLAAAEGRLAWSRWLRDVSAELKGNERSFDGWGKSARENQDTLIDGFGMAATAVQRMVDAGKVDADNFDAAWAGKAAKIVRQFVADGFDLKDIRKFLKANGLWTDELAAIFSKEKNAAAYAKAMTLGAGLGKDLARGLAQGIVAGTPGAAQNAKALVEAAERAAREAAETGSPSKVFARIGVDVVDGLIVGMGSKKDKVAQAATDMMQGLADKAGDMVSKWDEKLDGLKGVLDEAQSNVATWSKDMRESLLSGFDIGAAYEAAIGMDGKLSAANWIAGVDAQIAQMEWFGNVLNAIRANGGVNGQALMDYLAGKGAAVGGAMGQSLIDNGLVQTMADKLGLVQTNAGAMADSMVPPFLTAGVSQAQAMYDGFFANYGAGGPARVALENLMDRIAASLDRTSTITIRTVYEAAGLPRRAAGGPVAASTAYLVGEKGPEVFVPGAAGRIIPNGSLDMAPAATRAAAVAGAGAAGSGNADLVAEIRALRKEVRDQAERDRTMVRSNGYGR